MASTVIQVGAGLKLLDENGNASDLTLPTNVTLRMDVPPRWVTQDGYLILVNTPSQPLIIDNLGVVRLLSPAAPKLAATLSGQTGGTLTGTYFSRYTFVTMDANFNIISESDYSPVSNTVTIAAQTLRAAGLDISPDQISRRRLYRTTNNGAVLFQWVDLDGNIQTQIQDDLPDAGLSLVGAPTLGTPPRLTMAASFRGRLFGVGDINIDTVRYSQAGFRYAWPAKNIISIDMKGADLFGISGLIPRREALGVGRRNLLAQITGTGAEDGTGNVDFDVVILSRECGIESQETVKVFRDVAYFLWKDGVYSWGPEGLRCISDGQGGRGQVRTWFVTDDFFNRDKYNIAFAHIIPERPAYRLFLAAAGSSTVNSFVDYDINDGTWWGPHITGEFTPVSAFNRVTAADKVIPLIGGSAGNVYQQQNTRTDGAATPIVASASSKEYDMGDPEQNKFFGELSMFGQGEQTGRLDVVATVGELDADRAGQTPNVTTQYFDLSKTRQRLGRLGSGKHAQLDLNNAQAGEDPVILGFDIDPITIVGRR
jgi:hypothetical protein